MATTVYKIGDTVVPDGPILFEPVPIAPIDQGAVPPPTQTTNTEDVVQLETPQQQQERINNTPLKPLVQVSLYDNTVTPVVIADVTTVTAPRQYPVENPLLNYENYTYNLSLHGISITDYNNLVGDPGGYVPKQVLIAGGGRYSDTFPRNTYFQNTDFFFDDFRMTSVVNTTTRNKWSNLIECKFTIIEPIGFTLIKRIMSACMNTDGGINSPNYLKQPFILQIEFMGYKHGEEANSFMTETLKDHTKYLPIVLVEVKAKVTSRGTEYQFSAVPYNHTAFSPTKIVTPADFTVKAKTVQDIFGKGFTVSAELVDAAGREQSLQELNSLADAFGPGTNINAGLSQAFPDDGLCNKINAWGKVLGLKTGMLPNEYSVEFDPVIGASLIESGRVADVSTVAESGSAKTATQQAAGAKKSTINFSNQTINIPAGTNMGAVIEWAITNSKWFQATNIYNDAAAGSTGSVQGQDQRKAILNAFKIIPKIEIGAYDPGRADYSYKIVFQVKRWLANSKATNAPQGRTPGWVKEYNYLYSGGARSLATGRFTDNKDVIDLQIDFNMLYYTQLTAFKDKMKFQNTGPSLNLKPADITEQTSAVTGRAVSISPETLVRPKLQQGIDGLGSTSDALTNFSVNYVSKNSRTNVAKGSNVAARVAASDILSTQLIDVATGDMINVKLKIIGDPTFIKQDDVFYNSGISYSSNILTNNNSLRTDDSELYVFLTFRTPDDYDESTGLAIPGQNKFAYTEFTGVYKIVTIDSQFSKGKFEQTLDLVRLTTSDEKLEVAVINADRIESLLLAGAGQTTRFPSTLTFGPRIIQSTFSGSGTGLLQNLVGQGINAVTNKIVQEISTEVNSALAEIGSTLSSTLEGFALDAQEFLGGGVFSDLADVTADAAAALTGAGELALNFDLPSFDWSGVSDNFWV